jgi:hypothetical protein
VGVKLLIYEPPAAGAPFLTVAAQTQPEFEILYVEAHVTRAEAERTLARLASEFEKRGPDEPP